MSTSHRPARKITNCASSLGSGIASIAQVGDRIAWDTPVSGYSVGTITEILPVTVRTVSWTRGAGTAIPAMPVGVEFRVKFDDGAEVVSDLRQAGWRLVGAA